MNEDFGLFAPFKKYDEEQRMVWGYASTDTQDVQGEVVTQDAVKAALPDYMKWHGGPPEGNLREMHTNKAAGTVPEATFDDKGLYIGAHVSDDAAWKKVKDGTYKGFSIGGKKLRKSGNHVTGIAMYEISLVDRPANPDCRIDCFKAAGLTESGLIEPITPEERSLLGRLLAKFVGPIAEALEKREDPVTDGVKTGLEKGMSPMVPELARMVDDLRWLRRRVLYESGAEGSDLVDAKMAARIEELAGSLAELLRDKVLHEIDEGDDGADPGCFPPEMIRMAAENTDLQKRYAAGHKATFEKGAGYLSKAAKAGDKAQASIGNLEKCMTKMAKAYLAKGGDAEEADEWTSHLSAAKDSMETSMDHLDTAMGSVERGISMFGEGKSGGQDEDVSDAKSDAEKAAEAETLRKAAEDKTAADKIEAEKADALKKAAEADVDKDELKKMITDAIAEATAPLAKQVADLSGENEKLKKMASAPADSPKARLIAMHKSAGNRITIGTDPEDTSTDPMAGIDHDRLQKDASYAVNAGALAIGKMIMGGHGRSVMDGDFNGMATGK